MRLQHLDLGPGAGDRGTGSIAIGLGRGQGLISGVQIGLGGHAAFRKPSEAFGRSTSGDQHCLGCGKLCLGLHDIAFSGSDLRIDPCQCAGQFIKPGPCLLQLDAVIAVVDLQQHISRIDMLIGCDWDFRNIAGDLG